MTRLLICLLAAAALWPASAHAGAWHYDAQANTGSFDGQRDATTNPNVRALLAWSHDWLGRRGLHECATGPNGHVYMAPDLDDYADGRTFGCDVWLVTYEVSDANSGDAWALEQLGNTIGHELMHATRDAAHPDGWTHADMGEVAVTNDAVEQVLVVGPGIERDYQRACQRRVRHMIVVARRARRGAH